MLVWSVAKADRSAGGASKRRLTERDIQLLRAHIRSDKKQIIAEKLNLTDTQARRFWPVYDAYTRETTKLTDSRYAIIKEFARFYETMTDARADNLVQRMAELDEQVQTLRKQWIQHFRTALTGKQMAMFFQLDRRMNLVIDLQIAAEMPLVKN